MNVTFDPHLFTQIGLDSGSLTMLGTVVHSFAQPGEYRCVVHEGPDVKASFSHRAKVKREWREKARAAQAD